MIMRHTASRLARTSVVVTPHHAIATRLEIGRALRIIGQGVIVEMLGAIDFDDQLGGVRSEVGIVEAERNLPPEMQRLQRLDSKGIPESRFGWRIYLQSTQSGSSPVRSTGEGDRHQAVEGAVACAMPARTAADLCSTSAIVKRITRMPSPSSHRVRRSS